MCGIAGFIDKRKTSTQKEREYIVKVMLDLMKHRGGDAYGNGIENFWSFAKRRLAKFNGVSRKTFLLHLKECEFRYNHKHDMLKILERIIRNKLG